MPGRSLRTHNGDTYMVTMGDTTGLWQPALPTAHQHGAGGSLWKGHLSASFQPPAWFYCGLPSFAARAQLAQAHDLPVVPQEMSCCKTGSCRCLADLCCKGDMSVFGHQGCTLKKKGFTFSIDVFISEFLLSGAFPYFLISVAVDSWLR